MSGGVSFRRAVEQRDMDAAVACMSEDVVFRSPIAHHEYRGIGPTRFLLEHVVETFEDFVYVDDVEQGGTHILRFNARIGDREIDGVDILEIGSDGRVATFSVMVRPLSAAIALAEAMAARVEAAGGMPGSGD